MNKNISEDSYEKNGVSYVIQYSGYKNGKRVRVCPHCKKEKFLDEDFGFRVMEEGKVRNQSWCTKCRNEKN